MRDACGGAFDALVVGAGPAGSTVAIQLAAAGWSVALIEKQRFPRRKVCGECIAASNLPLLDVLGVGEAFETAAGQALREVSLHRRDRVVTAALPAADHLRHRWGRALGRETLDGLLLDRARAAGAAVFQPCAVQAIAGAPGDWQCEARRPDTDAPLRLRAKVLVDAHGSWEALSSQRGEHASAHRAGDLLAFKANFMASSLGPGRIGVLALDGGYGGMVVADGGRATLACCIRRDRLGEVRAAAPGLRAGDAVETWLRRDCADVQRALQGAVREGSWLSAGPLRPGVHLEGRDPVFRCGNAAGEAHPILGEGMSMALQSGALLAAQLLAHGAEVPDAATQAHIQRRYRAAWRRAFVPRLRLAALFAHLAMRPACAAAAMHLLRLWPGLLTRGARWGGKVRAADLAGAADTGRAATPVPATHPRASARKEAT